MGACSETEELDIFRCKVVKEFIEFKWKSYAGKYHYIGASIHVVYIIIFLYYVQYYRQLVYTDDQEKEKAYIQNFVINSMMILCLVYPCLYDMTQLFN